MTSFITAFSFIAAFCCKHCVDRSHELNSTHFPAYAKVRMNSTLSLSTNCLNAISLTNSSAFITDGLKN